MTREQSKRKLRNKKVYANARRVYRATVDAGMGRNAAIVAMNAAAQEGRVR